MASSAQFLLIGVLLSIMSDTPFEKIRGLILRRIPDTSIRHLLCNVGLDFDIMLEF
jgi:hypothetical protein